MKSLDCRVASLLAMTTASKHPWRSLRRWRPLRTAAIASELLFACLRVSVLSRRQRTLCRGHDFLDARQELHLQPEQRNGHIVTGDALDRREPVVHRLLGQLCGDFSTESGGARRFVHDYGTPGFFHRFVDGVE